MFMQWKLGKQISLHLTNFSIQEETHVQHNCICFPKDLETKEVIGTNNAASCVELWPTLVLITAKTTQTSTLIGAEAQVIAKGSLAASSQ
jgi:hypothetical protein